MFAKRGELVSAANRLNITGVPDVDYKIDGNKDCIFLYTANKQELKKGSRHRVTLESVVKPSKRLLLVKPHPDLLDKAIVTGTTWMDPEDDGIIELNVTPKWDIDLSELEYICKIYMESLLR